LFSFSNLRSCRGARGLTDPWFIGSGFLLIDLPPILDSQSTSYCYHSNQPTPPSGKKKPQDQEECNDLLPRDLHCSGLSRRKVFALDLFSGFVTSHRDSTFFEDIRKSGDCLFCCLCVLRAFPPLVPLGLAEAERVLITWFRMHSTGMVLLIFQGVTVWLDPDNFLFSL
jgi:hypothetical protein